MKKFNVIIIAFIMLFSLSSCGSNESGSSNAAPVKEKGDAGYYVIAKVTQSGETVEGEELEEADLFAYVLLNEDGTFITNFGEDDIDTGIWEKGILNFQNDKGEIEDSIDYKLDGDELTIDWGGDFIIVYARSTDTPPVERISEGDSTEKLSEFQQLWDGEWYGYWETHSVSDGYRQLDDGKWDCYAVIDIKDDDTGTIYLWEAGEDFATVEITISEDGGQGDMGVAISEKGRYWEGSKIVHADWIIDPSLYGYRDYIVIDGRYEDNEGDGFNYVMYLRPWGLLWDDIEEDERPPEYENWYLDNYDELMLDVVMDYSGYIHSEIVYTKEVQEKSASNGAALVEEPLPLESENTDLISVSQERNGITVTATIPSQTWVSEDGPFGFNLYSLHTFDSVYSGSPRISINIEPDIEKFDLHIEHFENIESIENRIIGGIDMIGRTYTNVGMDWIEYRGMVDADHAVSVNSSKIDISSGEGNDVMNSIVFN